MTKKINLQNVNNDELTILVNDRNRNIEYLQNKYIAFKNANDMDGAIDAVIELREYAGNTDYLQIELNNRRYDGLI